MDFIDKYSTFSKAFYLVILGLTIPFYLVLYGASGHKFDPQAKDLLSMFVVIIPFVTLIVFWRLRKKSGLWFNLMRILVTITLSVTAYSGMSLFLFMIQFDYDQDISLFIRGLFYLIPLFFTFSTLIILLGLFKKAEQGKTS